MEAITERVGPASGQRLQPHQHAVAQPVSFAGTFGLYQPAEGAKQGVVRKCAVLFLQPWGFEEMCTHKLFRIIAEELACEGIASLRFDYPGTGDALDPPDRTLGLSLWQDTIRAALEVLAEKTGGLPVILLGHGLGASLGVGMAAELDGLAGFVAMAPVASGRAYLRELQFWARVIDDGLGLAEHLRLSGMTAIAGHVMPDAKASALKKTDFSAVQPHRSIPHLFVNRADRPGDGQMAKQLEAKGARVESIDYPGYDAMVGNPAMARMPMVAAEHVISWIVRRAAALGEQKRPLAIDPSAVSVQDEDQAHLDGGDFRETALRFGRGKRLYGILCEPTGPRSGASVLLLNTAYDRSAGWGRSGVAMARKLAGDGIASLRFDVANVGDSPPVPGLPDQVLYAETQYDDVEAALAVLEERSLLPSVVAGRCSGGYLGFSCMTKDHRIAGACLVNPFVFYWDKRRRVEDGLAVVPRSLDTYKHRLFQMQTLRRLWRGKVDVKNATRNFALVGVRRVLNRLGLAQVFSRDVRLEHWAVRVAFAALAKRKTPLVLLYSEQDVGLDHFYQHFGSQGRKLERYPNVRTDILAETDHNFSPAAAQQRYFEEIKALAMTVQASKLPAQQIKAGVSAGKEPVSEPEAS
ncbi:alpha/beta fold hydrolase [Agrobacterium vitis]|uniref:Alpha/beta fold hydrolase n=1 Tax=Agrobacterium vitis TaxID=373 RepID=A0AAE5AYJ0_AGRVI|nr:alpha/beta fold hydrolase [Agrobacterium vitis]MCF1501645.1 alpha/beta fold hydrolase [Allorhizobium sp. Av2]MCM2443212.1 alpha/beta fold hydrolase [Agrobacterium vitis]MUZ60804.1 alpha/beta fold hydrolase [Agrobacterium vitis]MVA69059.1 alpha/beta fold hydrolase [Agrobacterium vitis]MVA90128.1 alpha/beta fold hydrolase [Agrobacterium vitis]